jgi:hypothetical protein
VSIVTEIDKAGAASVAVHVRRADYVSLPSAAAYHGALSTSYYLDSLRVVEENLKSPRYFVFSDDANWCRTNLPFDQTNTVFVSSNQGNNAWQDLILISLCRNCVIANSSFSWWGAWLGDQRWIEQRRLVIAPRRWFAGNKNDYTADRIPSYWKLSECS